MKHTKMTTAYEKKDGFYGSVKAVDGGSYRTWRSCASTSVKNAWWQVDLQAIYLIREVVISHGKEFWGELEFVDDRCYFRELVI